MEVKFNREDRVIITLNDKTMFEGNVKVYCEDTKILSLKNVMQSNENELLPGVIDFQLSDICDLKVKKEKARNKSKRDGVLIPRVMRKLTRGEYCKILNLQRYFRLINDVTPAFHTAITDMQKSKMVGLCVKDIFLGQLRSITAMAFATENGIYIFDLEELGTELFFKGVSVVLESKYIIKVVYDCRFLANSLYHLHGITLNNVRDIEAEDLVLGFYSNGYVRRSTRPYSFLIQYYLGIPGVSVEEENINEPWKNITENASLQTFLANYVSYLIPVQKSIENEHLQKLMDASNIYSAVTKDTTDLKEILSNIKQVTHKQMTSFLTPRLSRGTFFSKPLLGNF